MHPICLTLPTNRDCVATIGAMLAEAAYAVENFDVQVDLLILDSCGEREFAAHAAAAATTIPGVTVHHLDEARQREFLREAIAESGVRQPGHVLDLMLPTGVSYGACTNRAFLIASALGCVSFHRRDSDSRYQEFDGAPVFPIHHELTSIGLRAGEATRVSEVALDPVHANKPVVLVGASFIGDLSVDIAEIRELDPEAYEDIVGLWAPADATEGEKRELVAESFTGAGTEPFTGDRSILTIVDPMRVDMCNIAFHDVQELVPLPPATDTIGSDYFLLHLIRTAALPGVLHNRHIVNFHTPERKTDAGFADYHLRLAKFFLSMLYLRAVYDGMAAAGETLLDEGNRVRPGAVAELVRRSTRLDVADNVRRLEVLDAAYRRLGGKYARLADTLIDRRDQLLDEARADMADFAVLIDAWAPLVGAAARIGLGARRR
ncbi:DUF6271 family protein [Actinokineospora diospyrosa]|uniref:Uncharacterized protein n=1 Tax=Actinokineospora diospyrosa TaxID=103728 RepID=A0ABT1IBS0_9PSEU|nr:DUF6271 family protein [Actinokineospora diospyrosa]MCP2270084.1 hypothetical protein [Actinokineospora diospyrosa]